MSKYPGCNERERRSSLVKDENHWPSLSIIGEGNILVPKLAEREKDSGGVSAATRIERGTTNWGSPPRPWRKRQEQGKPYKSEDEVGRQARGWRMSP
ncbi:MAG: hypothetical protein AAB277_00385 [Planctomycetota bacterium]